MGCGRLGLLMFVFLHGAFHATSFASFCSIAIIRDIMSSTVDLDCTRHKAHWQSDWFKAFKLHPFRKDLWYVLLLQFVFPFPSYSFLSCGRWLVLLVGMFLPLLDFRIVLPIVFDAWPPLSDALLKAKVNWWQVAVMHLLTSKLVGSVQQRSMHMEALQSSLLGASVSGAWLYRTNDAWSTWRLCHCVLILDCGGEWRESMFCFSLSKVLRDILSTVWH